MAMKRIEDMSEIEMEAAFGDFFDLSPKQKEHVLGHLVVSEAFIQNVQQTDWPQGIKDAIRSGTLVSITDLSEMKGGFRRGELNIICTGGITR
ncbi:hypothetical protein HYQ26_gp157 [Salmonella phage Se-G]|uniref:hypothetical protein n=1 Tax=Salmonella phage Se-G TaxID=2698907 RepID=UPI0018AF8284|nr:hypothetical protein HYQ26_gp157 [Salmonella phage Se-G]